jgi:hypothetical protein
LDAASDVVEHARSPVQHHHVTWAHVDVEIGSTDPRPIGAFNPEDGDAFLWKT